MGEKVGGGDDDKRKKKKRALFCFGFYSIVYDFFFSSFVTIVVLT